MTRKSYVSMHRELRSPRSKSGGIVLVLALILLVVITISSVVAMRAATSSDIVSQNLRAQNLALQAAEIALRYCERQLMNNAPLTVFSLGNPDPAVPDEWRIAANWAAGRVNTVPAAFLGAVVNYATPPQCIVRRMTFEEVYGADGVASNAIRPEDRGVSQEYIFIFRITARGYSPDFQINTGGVSSSGAEAWVQSTIRTIL